MPLKAISLPKRPKAAAIAAPRRGFQQMLTSANAIITVKQSKESSHPATRAIFPATSLLHKPQVVHFDASFTKTISFTIL